MGYVTIKEGDTEVLVPKHRKGAGPRGVNSEVFFNPAMALNRDVSVSFLRAYADETKVLDGMSATGIRGVRIANEVEVGEVTMLDISRSAVDLIQKNIDHAGVDASVHNESIEKHLIENRYRYDYIDIDPFGTPVPYFPLAARFVSRDGILAVTATDTAVLCGTYKKKCIRRYSAVPKNNWCRHELGLRILIGYCVRETARYDKSATPVLSYYDGHHFRTYLKIEEGASCADDSIDQLKRYNFDDHSWDVGGEVGPLWGGNIFDDGVLEKLEPVGLLDEGMIDMWKEESSFPPFFYDTNVMGSVLKRSPPPLDMVIDEIRDSGHRASKTHFSPTGFKSDADGDEIISIFSNI